MNISNNISRYAASEHCGMKTIYFDGLHSRLDFSKHVYQFLFEILWDEMGADCS